MVTSFQQSPGNLLYKMNQLGLMPCARQNAKALQATRRHNGSVFQDLSPAIERRDPGNCQSPFPKPQTRNEGKAEFFGRSFPTRFWIRLRKAALKNTTAKFTQRSE